MDALLSAVASDLVGRFISFLVARFQPPDDPDDAARLRRLLLRAGAVVEEADARLVTAQGMLLQLQSLRCAMYRGYYVLDTLDIHAAGGGAATAKRQPPSGRRRLQTLQLVVESLETTLRNAKEFLDLLTRCPAVPSRPYGTYLFMERCMFGRRAEKELVVSFLLEPCSSSVSMDVLPIIGAYDVGKRTLVHHACADDRVRGHLSQVLQLDGDALTVDDHQQLAGHLPPPGGGTTLIVVEYKSESVDVAAWRRLCASVRRATVDAKVIVVGRTEQIARLGTAPPLRLRSLRREEYWYFFRVLAFGSADPADHPALLPLARRMVAKVRRSFMAANVFTRLLRANLSAPFWLGVLQLLSRSVPHHAAAFGAHPWELIAQCRPYYIHNYSGGPLFLCYEQYKSPAAAAPRPECCMQNIMDGSMKPGPGGEVQVLIWQSPVPPHYDYLLKCRLLEEKTQTPPQPMLEQGTKQLKRKRRSRTQHTSSSSSLSLSSPSDEGL
ncbi:hypothetical protein ACP70R_031358 [Stipagrostis hirtigluma subsp. patula]